MIFIYVLWAKNKVVYVGQTNNPNRRLSQHRRAIKDGWQWIYKWCREHGIVEKQLKMYIVETLYTTSEYKIAKRETEWINHLLKEGHELQNQQNPLSAFYAKKKRLKEAKRA